MPIVKTPSEAACLGRWLKGQSCAVVMMLPGVPRKKALFAG
jgi:hypothetical protein